jgi:flagellar motor switch protein FliG
MSMLARFRKPGGVQQLVALLESCLSKKKEALLTTIMAEDPQFGAMVKNKILTPEKIFSWDPLTICEATTKLGERTLAAALKGLPQEAMAIATHTMRDRAKRDLMNIFETIKPTPVQIESAIIKLIETFRVLEKEGSLKLDENNNPVSLSVVGFKKAA